MPSGFLREVQVEIERGRWIDPRCAEAALASWAQEFLSLSRRQSPTTQDVLAPSSVHRHYRVLRRVLQVAVEKERILANPCDRVAAAAGAETGDFWRRGSGCARNRRRRPRFGRSRFRR